MRLKITGKQKNSLLGREEIAFEISEISSTPARKEVREKIVQETGAKPELVVLEKIKQGFGSKTASGTALIFSGEKHLKEKAQKFPIERTDGKKPVEENPENEKKE